MLLVKLVEASLFFAVHGDNLFTVTVQGTDTCHQVVKRLWICRVSGFVQQSQLTWTF